MRKILVLLFCFCLTTIVNGQSIKLVPNPDTSAVGFDGNNAIEFNGSLYATYLNKFGKRQLAKCFNKVVTLINNPDTGGIIRLAKFTILANKLYFLYDKTGSDYANPTTQFAKFDGTSVTLITNPPHYISNYSTNKITKLNNKFFVTFQNDTSGETVVAKYDGNNFSIVTIPFGISISENDFPFVFKNKICYFGHTNAPNYYPVIASYNDTVFTLTDTVNGSLKLAPMLLPNLRTESWLN